MRRAAGIAGLVAVAIGVVALATLFFVSRDGSTTSSPSATDGPGVAAVDPPALVSSLRRGNVVLEADAPLAKEARALAERLGGPDSPALREAGQAVRVVPVPADRSRGGVVALASGRRLAAASVDDPALRDFVEFWLGRTGG
jgi:hypothetical protein